MKYIDADKIRAEIERRIEETKSMKPSFDQFWAGQISAFKGVRTIIDSLQQEQPSDDLEEAAEKSAAQYYKDAGYSPFPNVETAAHKSGFFAGAEWQKEQMPMPEDTLIFRKGVEEGRRLEREDTLANLSYNELMELYKNIRDEIRRREDGQ